jgi:hypothetical protein
MWIHFVVWYKNAKKNYSWISELLENAKISSNQKVAGRCLKQIFHECKTNITEIKLHYYNNVQFEWKQLKIMFQPGLLK